MNKKEISKILKEGVKVNKKKGNLPDDLHELFDPIFGVESKQPEGYTIVLEEEFGGEGQGELYWYVFSV